MKFHITVSVVKNANSLQVCSSNHPVHATHPGDVVLASLFYASVLHAGSVFVAHYNSWDKSVNSEVFVSKVGVLSHIANQQHIKITFSLIIKG